MDAALLFNKVFFHTSNSDSIWETFLSAWNLFSLPFVPSRW
jgi:hypothetical protein